MKKAMRNNLVFWCTLLLTGIIYSIIYNKNLIQIETITYDVKYTTLYRLVVIPILYLSVSVIIATLIQKWSSKNISAEFRKTCMICAVLLILIYTIFVVNFNLNINENKVIKTILDYPVLFIISGVLISIGLSKNEISGIKNV